MRWMALSRFPKSAWCRCFRFVCWVRPPGDRQTLLQVGTGHSQCRIRTTEGGRWRVSVSPEVKCEVKYPILVDTVEND